MQAPIKIILVILPKRTKETNAGEEEEEEYTLKKEVEEVKPLNDPLDAGLIYRGVYRQHDEQQPEPCRFQPLW